MYTEILYHENINSGVRFCVVCPPPVATPLWNQAKDTVVPKLTESGEVIQPEEVIEDIEQCLGPAPPEATAQTAPAGGSPA